MNAYIYNADLYCENCAEAIKNTLVAPSVEDEHVDSNNWPIGPYPDGGGEADYPQHCGNCNMFLENPLTSDGEQYVQNPGGVIPLLWVDFYTYLPFNQLHGSLCNESLTGPSGEKLVCKAVFGTTHTHASLMSYMKTREENSGNDSP